MGFEQAVSNWLHVTYSDASHLYSAASQVMSDPLNIDHVAYALKDVTDAAWSTSYDLTPAGFLASLWHGFAVNNQQQFSNSWPVGDGNLSTGEKVTEPPLVIPNAYRAAIQGTYGGRPIVNVIGLLGSSSGSAATAAAALKTAWEATGGPCKTLPTGYVMQSYTVTDLSSATGAVATLSSTTAGAGVAGVSDRGSCILIKFSGGTRSRSSNGRVYYGPTMGSWVASDGATIVSGTLTTLNTMWSGFMNSLSTAGFPLCVLSRKTQSAHVVSAWTVTGTLATQRRRIRGG